MSLLEQVTKENDTLNVILPQTLKDYLKTQHQNEITKFSNDSEFVQVSEFIFILNSQKFHLQKQFSQELMKNFKNEKEFSKSAENLLNSIDRVKKVLKENIKQRIEKTKEENALLPRILRLSKKFQLTEKETEAILFILISQSGIQLALIDSSSEASLMGMHSDMSSHELLSFLSPNRQHVKQGIVEVDSSYRDTFSGSVMKLPKEVLHALVGGQLTASEFLKIDKTFLSDILTEEPTFYIQGISDDKEIILDKETRSQEDLEEEELEKELKLLELSESEDKSFDLYTFIKTEQTKQESNPTNQKSTETSETPDDSILTPYTTDVEYLDDLFKFFTIKIKLRNQEMELKNDDSEFKGSRDRNPESIMRELRGKQRMLAGKCEKRLKLTLEKKEWIPRLERLAEIRQLNQFEKWILVLLIGGIISHDMRQAAFSFSLRRASKSDFDVGYILWILCDELQERINQRRIFYKNSNLIRDGFVKLSEMINGKI
jgi:uncharacterized protein (DUF2164 family)